MNCFKIALAVLCIFTSFTFADAVTFDKVGTRQRDLKNYGGAEVSAVHQGEDAFCFRCDVKGWPAVIGQDVPVRVAGLQLPDIVAEQPVPNKFFKLQAIKFLTGFLKDAKKIELANIRRGKDFCLVADVIADSNSVAEALIERGFAKKAEIIKSINKPDIKKVIEPKIIAAEKITWIASSSSKVFHKSTCGSAKRMKKDKTIQFPTREKAIETGRRPCKTCKP